MRSQRGFTLVELMVVTLIIAILIALAVPSFQSSRQKAADAAAKADIRTGIIATKTVMDADGLYIDDPARLALIERTLAWIQGDVPLATDSLYVKALTAPNVLFLSAKSTSGTCFYFRDQPVGGGTGFAQDPACGPAGAQIYLAFW